MIAALTLAVIYAISVTFVRVASVILEHTGLPKQVARLQSVSAMSGAGFTTSESELVVNHPTRRRVMVWLMIIGNMGLASVAATLIVSFIGTDGGVAAISTQVLLMLVIVGGAAFIVNNGALDDWMCALIGKFVSPNMGDTLNKTHDEVYRDDSGYTLARHFNCNDVQFNLSKLSQAQRHAEFIVLNIDNDKRLAAGGEADMFLEPGNGVLIFGSVKAHQEIASIFQGLSSK